ncbi:hypothetical protein M1248_02735 [Mycobacterium sp. 29Ha]|nr:hypothetical protein [Mycobacterium sp. 29Ha]
MSAVLARRHAIGAVADEEATGGASRHGVADEPASRSDHVQRVGLNLRRQAEDAREHEVGIADERELLGPRERRRDAVPRVGHSAG